MYAMYPDDEQEQSFKAPKAYSVDNLDDLKNIIRTLQFCDIPYSFLDETRLDELEDDGKITNEIHQEIDRWKESEGIVVGKKNAIQSIISLLKSLDAVTDVSILPDDLNKPLGFSGPFLNTFLEKKTKGTKLTEIGYQLLELINGDSNSNYIYQHMLFWRFLSRPQINVKFDMVHYFQKLIQVSDSYHNGIKDVLLTIETDKWSRALLLKWAKYFDLTSLDSDKLVKTKVSKKIISAVIFELNLLRPDIYSIEKLASIISKKLDLSRSYIDFFLIFEIILAQVYSSDEENKAIEGKESSRNNISLPNFSKINMLQINHKINTQIILDEIKIEILEQVIVTNEET